MRGAGWRLEMKGGEGEGEGAGGRGTEGGTLFIKRLLPS